ncbi:DUF1003 domain-containing protein [Frankia sp. AiPs1]|uniref:DUF1003 domain-containing protein n=1 Tax=Frankia sp. AiPs1 TaxID=573493 RepID=UPI002042E989|nr:DUF1003 domain-containing protein [Frankia sp. AiPs1]MCM3922192.1 DUF1003 domain-containing protein [Frankia sp. AiPs1]
MTISATRTTDRRGLGTDRLDLPVSGRVALLPRVDRETVSRVAETIARFLGTGRYLAIQTGIVIVWIALNIALPLMRWDPYPFILLNLAFSTQAAYAAPLILLAQNRQDDRDRASLTEDRAVAGRMREDTEFLTREVAALRLAQSEAATRQYVRGELAGQLEALRGDLESLLREAVELPRQPQAARRSGVTAQPGAFARPGSSTRPGTSVQTGTSAQSGPDGRQTTGSAAAPPAARDGGADCAEDADGPVPARTRAPKPPKGSKRTRAAKIASANTPVEVPTGSGSRTAGSSAERSPAERSPAERSPAEGPLVEGPLVEGSPAVTASRGGASRISPSLVGVGEARHAGGITQTDETEPTEPTEPVEPIDAGPGSAPTHLDANAVDGCRPAAAGGEGAPVAADSVAAEPMATDAARADTGAGGSAAHRAGRTAPSRGHHRSPLHVGSARRSAERTKSGESPTVDAASRHVS